MQLIGELIDTAAGRPVVVVGGGPSAPAALEALRDTYKLEPAYVLSANEHGHKQSFFPITHSVCCDATHGETRQSMETVLRRYGKPIISPHHFADVRLTEWTLAANTGLTAIAVGVFLGGTPVIVTGIDCYRVADRAAPIYFHAPAARSNSATKTPENFKRQFKALTDWIGAAAPVRFFNGNSLGAFPPWDPGERLAPYLPPRARYYRTLPRLLLQARPRGQVTFKMAMIEPGRLFAATPHEALGLINNRGAKLIESHPAPDGTPAQLPPELSRRPIGYRPAKPAGIRRR